jgi:segregation and condensation protein B
VASEPDQSTQFHSENEEANVNISLTTVVLSAKLLGEQLVPMGRCESAGQPDEVPTVTGYADDEDEEDLDEDEDEEDEEDVDDLDEDEDQEDEDEDDEELDDDWEEVVDEEEEEDDEEDE